MIIWGLDRRETKKQPPTTKFDLKRIENKLHDKVIIMGKIKVKSTVSSDQCSSKGLLSNNSKSLQAGWTGTLDPSPYTEHTSQRLSSDMCYSYQL